MRKLFIIGIASLLLSSCAQTGIVEKVIRANSNCIKGDLQIRNFKTNQIETIKNTKMFLKDDRINEKYTVKYNNKKVKSIVNKGTKK